MNTIIIKGSLVQASGIVKQRVGSLTHNNSLYFNGKQEEWIGRAMKQYGRAKDWIHHHLSR